MKVDKASLLEPTERELVLDALEKIALVLNKVVRHIATERLDYVPEMIVAEKAIEQLNKGGKK